MRGAIATAERRGVSPLLIRQTLVASGPQHLNCLPASGLASWARGLWSPPDLVGASPSGGVHLRRAVWHVQQVTVVQGEQPVRTMPTRLQPVLLKRLHGEVLALLEATSTLEREMQRDVDSVPAEQRASARNLIHYLAIRRHDIRALQVELGHLGLSSLGRLEAHVAAGLESVLVALSRLADEPLPAFVSDHPPTHFHEGDELLARHTDALFGPPRSNESIVRIMVTLPTEAAEDSDLVRNLVSAGMDVARINTAHDSAPVWRQMAHNVQAAAAEQGRVVRVLLDLAGPKLRTGDIEPGPTVLKVRPKRDERGIVTEPAHVRLVSTSETPSADAPTIPIDAELLTAIAIGDRIRLSDTRGRKRALTVVGRDETSATAIAERSVWFETGLTLTVIRAGENLVQGRVGVLASRPGRVQLQRGSELIITGPNEKGRRARIDSTGRVVETARVPCLSPESLRDVRVGERVSFDDGAIAGVIEGVDGGELRVRITFTRPGGGTLRADKGINFPDTSLTLPSLTPADLAALDVAVRCGDLVGLSFVRSAADIDALHAALAHRGAAGLGVVVKIETRRGFENLPQILLAALRRPPAGVMVARGDLGAELGFERMAEVQEQILWLCEAAHVPVIWATQVLEGLAKTGVPTRGEVTDAAMSARAECVMLNKGPYIELAVRFLDDVLARMRDHYIKKTPMLRRLKVSEGRWEVHVPQPAPPANTLIP